ncbi:MAG: hypothetical protein ACT4PZ_08635 [Panacagrimonas sp.]
MTRKTLRSLTVAATLAITATSPVASAWVAVSLPGNAMTMSGATYTNIAPSQTAPTAVIRAPRNGGPKATGSTTSGRGERPMRASATASPQGLGR